MKEKSKYYLTNKEFLIELRKYHNLGKISRRLHEIFYLLSERISHKSLFYRRMKEQHIKSVNISDIDAVPHINSWIYIAFQFNVNIFQFNLNIFMFI